MRGNTKARQRLAATATWGTTRVNALNLVEDACNGTTPVVYDMIEDKQVRNREETALAAQKIRDLHEAFATWVWEDPGRADLLAGIYNRLYNNIKVRTFDGGFLTFPGLSAGWNPYPHQVDMVARNLFTPTTLCGHVVGAGKTFVAVATAYKLRQLGLVRKPCMVVPNHLLEQTCAEARRYFPAMRILMVTREDLTPDRRKYFAAKCAAADWDLVVMTHQQFGSLNVHPDIQAAYYATLLDELDAAQDNPAVEESRATMKMLARKRKRLIAKLDALADMRRDGGVTFDQTLIDYLVIDESQAFKNLDFTCRAEGFSTAGSKRADDLLMKLTHLRGRNPDGRAAMLMTGTPVSNSLAELWVLFKYCDPRILAEHGLQSFDAFAAQFIRYATMTEVAPDGGGFRSHRRPRLFVNLPELRSMLWQFADIRTRADLNLDGPEVTVEQVVADPPPEMKEFITALVARADAIRNGHVNPREDNMLKVCGEGRAAALWMSMVGIDATGPGKIEACAANVVRIYHETAGAVYDDPKGDSLFDPRPGGFQVVFCDQGTPDSWDYGVYHRVRDLLIEQGIPAKKIAFIHQARQHGDRPALFQRCRTGDIAVLLGSTEKLGTGVNIQRRLLAIHHLDAPWRPADIEQRDGRGDRPGNGNARLRVFRYATKGSFDAYMWQALERKARFIAQVLTGAAHVREAEVVDSAQVLSYGELKALATGQPLLLMQSEVNAEIARLRVSLAGHKRAQTRMEAEKYMAERRVAELQEEAGRLRRIAAKAAATAVPLYIPDAGGAAEGLEAAAEELGRYLAGIRQNRRPSAHFRWRGVSVTILFTYPKKGAPLLAARLASESYLRERDGHTFTLTGHVWAAGTGPARILELVDAQIDAAEKLAGERDELRETIAERATELASYSATAWPHQAELAAALARRDAIDAEIDAQVAGSRPRADPVPVG